MAAIWVNHGQDTSELLVRKTGDIILMGTKTSANTDSLTRSLSLGIATAEKAYDRGSQTKRARL